MFGSLNASRKPLITIALLAISIIVALLSGLGDRIESVYGLFYSVYTQPQFLEIKQGQLWRLVTPIFLHFGILHLLMNGVMMWYFGRILEPLHGAVVYLSIIIVMAIISNTAQYLVTGPLFGGLSGVIYGLLGFVWSLGKFSSYYPIRLDPRFTWFVVGWFILCWSGLLEKIGIHIANTAHTAGLISGIILAYCLAKFPRHN